MSEEDRVSDQFELTVETFAEASGMTTVDARLTITEAVQQFHLASGGTIKGSPMDDRMPIGLERWPSAYLNAKRCGCGHAEVDHDTEGCREWWRHPDLLNARRCGCTMFWTRWVA